MSIDARIAGVTNHERLAAGSSQMKLMPARRCYATLSSGKRHLLVFMDVGDGQNNNFFNPQDFAWHIGEDLKDIYFIDEEYENESTIDIHPLAD